MVGGLEIWKPGDLRVRGRRLPRVPAFQVSGLHPRAAAEGVPRRGPRAVTRRPAVGTGVAARGALGGWAWPLFCSGGRASVGATPALVRSASRRAIGAAVACLTLPVQAARQQLLLLLTGRARHRAVGTVHAAAAGLGLEHDVALFALVGPQTGVGRHRLRLDVPTLRAGERRFENFHLPESYLSPCDCALPVRPNRARPVSSPASDTVDIRLSRRYRRGHEEVEVHGIADCRDLEGG